MAKIGIFNKIRKEAKKYFAGAKGSHNWDHTERVYNLALHIGKKEKADLEVLKIAALLHDIKRKEEDEKLGEVCHAEMGAGEAEKILKKYKFSDDFINSVTSCIKTHRNRGNNFAEKESNCH